MTALFRPPGAVKRRGLASCLSLSTVLISRLFSYDHVVIGAGVVGLAVAAKLAEYTTLLGAVVGRPANA